MGPFPYFPGKADKKGKLIIFWRVGGGGPELGVKYVLVLNLNSLFQDNFHVCAFASVMRELPEKGARYVYLVQLRILNCSRMCVCVH